MNKLLLLTLLLFAVLQAEALTPETWTDSNGVIWTYTLSGSNATIRESSKTSGSLDIPNKVNGYTVTSIGLYAFAGCSGLTSVTIPEGVTYIGDAAFAGCSGLTSMTIPSSVTSIGNNAFNGCTGLTSVTILEGVTDIGDYAFSDCTGLTSMTIPSSVTSIGGGAFLNCSDLAKVIVPNIAAWCGISFGGQNDNPLSFAKHLYSDENTEITDLVIPEGVTSIGKYAFNGCSSLMSVTIPSSVTSIGNDAFNGCTGLTNVDILEGVTSIGAAAFQGCSGLTSVTIPPSVTSIGNNAFNGCTGLTKVIVPDLTAWCAISFGNEYANPLYYAKHLYSDDNTEITNLVIPEGVTSIGSSAFYDCSGLTSVTIPSSVTSIGDYAFDKCSGLTNVTISSNVILSKDYTADSNIKHIFGSQVKEYIIGDGVTSIGKYAFWNCAGLTSVTIRSSVTTIGKYAFSNCTGLTKVIVPDIAAWCGIYFSNNSANPLYYAKHIYSDENTEIIDLTIPESVTSICFAAFWNCSSLKSVTFPSGLQSINESAFKGCSNITDLKLNCETIEDWFADIKTSVKILTIGEGTTTISDSAFEGFSVLTTVSLGSNVSNIGANAFANLSKLEDVYCYAIRYPRVDASTFQGSYVEYVTLHVPEASIQQYQNHAVWGEFFQIVPIDDSSAINDIYSEGNRPEIEAIYDLNGQRQPALRPGINIIKMNDGTIKKVMVK